MVDQAQPPVNNHRRGYVGSEYTGTPECPPSSGLCGATVKRDPGVGTVLSRIKPLRNIAEEDVTAFGRETIGVTRLYIGGETSEPSIRAERR